MDANSVKIDNCSAEFRPAALSLVLSKLPRLQRESCVDTFAHSDQPGLFVVEQNGEVLAACWVQPQPGNCAIFWPPQGDDSFADQLATQAAAYLDKKKCGLSQVSLTSERNPAVPVILRQGFERLAELHYLSSPTSGFDFGWEAIRLLAFEPFRSSEMKRLQALIEQTYFKTLDCPSLNGVRKMDEVMEGYQATGTFDPSLWAFVRRDDKDIGVLLLTAHPELESFELVYMGLIHEARGQGYGLDIVNHAKKTAYDTGASQIVLAVDAANLPAANIYLQAGFTAWDRRIVYVRTLRAAARQRDIEVA